MPKRRRAPMLVGAIMIVVGLTAAGTPAMASELDVVTEDDVVTEEVPLELLDAAAAEDYVETIGLETTSVVFQQGTFNYAGPSCPGLGWTCTSGSQPVVQLSDGGVNIFVGTADADGECTIVQSNTTGDNEATCTVTTSTNGTTQRASITQDNGSGANDATVDMDATVAGTVAVGVSASFDQTIRQESEIRQDSDSGANTATIDEDLSLSATARTVSSATSKQDGFSIAIVDQDSVSGDQDVVITQDQTLTSTVLDITNQVSQEQQTHATSNNVLAYVDQRTTDGNNTVDLDQTQNATTVADRVLGSVSSIQGNDVGGMRGDIDVDSVNGTSVYDADITKSWTIDQDANVAVQNTDPECCDFLTQHLTPTSCSISESVNLVGPAVATQDAHARGRAFADVTCDVSLTVSLTKGSAPAAVTSEQRSGDFVDVAIDCEAGACTTTERPESEPVGQDGNLHYAVRNVTDGEAFSAIDGTTPNFTSADPGEILEFKIEMHNHTSDPLSDMTLFGEVPSHTTFYSCKACVNGTPDLVTGKIRFNVGLGNAGGKRIGLFKVVVNGDAPDGIFSSHATATVDTAILVSNTVHYWIRG